MKTSKTSKFEISEYLDNEEMIKEYLNVVLEEGTSEEIVVALGHVAKAKGMTEIAKITGMSRASLYKSLSEGSHPQFETILKVLRAVGWNLRVS
ncbi:MAG: putative addiction module antidote protein [Cyclobacteriaceae bacterium]|nr:putative addiction module antidote protein [Cyclobacteriaceae bacterium]